MLVVMIDWFGVEWGNRGNLSSSWMMVHPQIIENLVKFLNIKSVNVYILRLKEIKRFRQKMFKKIFGKIGHDYKLIF